MRFGQLILPSESCPNEQSEGTYVAPAIIISIVFALAKQESIDTNTMTEITIITSLRATLLSVMQITSGASRSRIMTLRINIRADRLINEPEETYILGSREIL